MTKLIKCSEFKFQNIFINSKISKVSTRKKAGEGEYQLCRINTRDEPELQSLDLNRDYAGIQVQAFGGGDVCWSKKWGSSEA